MMLVLDDGMRSHGVKGVSPTHRATLQRTGGSKEWRVLVVVHLEHSQSSHHGEHGAFSDLCRRYQALQRS